MIRNYFVLLSASFLIAACDSPQTVDEPAPVEPTAAANDGVGILVFGDSGYHLNYPDQDDFDGDGLSNLAEEIAGTSAADASSVLAIAAGGENPGGGFELWWHSVAGRTYAVQSSTNLTAGFTLLEGGIAADPPMNTYATTVSEAATFFIIVIEP